MAVFGQPEGDRTSDAATGPGNYSDSPLNSIR